MTYTKPQLNGFSAVSSIQSSSTQKIGPHFEPDRQSLTVPAYEADE